MKEDLFSLVLLATLPSVVVGGTVFIMLKKYFDAENRKRTIEFRSKNARTTLPLRLQAYERMILLLERLNFNSLLLRIKEPGMSAAALHHLLVEIIRAEFEHNLSQQIYLGHDTWVSIVNSKEDLIKKIHQSYAMVGQEASSLDLSKKIVELFMEDETQLMLKAQLMIKREAADLLS